MSVIALTAEGDHPSVVTDREQFALDGQAILILDADMSQLDSGSQECNSSYDLRVGDHYRDHRFEESRTIVGGSDDSIAILPGMAVIIQTLEEVEFPKWRFGHIVPRVSLLQEGLANTPTKLDPGYHGRLLITTFNHGKRPVHLKRGDPFCAMFVSTVEGAIRPYNGKGKSLRGTASKGFLRHVADQLEARPAAISAAAATFTLIGLIVAIISLLT